MPTLHLTFSCKPLGVGGGAGGGQTTFTYTVSCVSLSSVHRDIDNTSFKLHCHGNHTCYSDIVVSVLHQHETSFCLFPVSPELTSQKESTKFSVPAHSSMNFHEKVQGLYMILSRNLFTASCSLHIHPGSNRFLDSPDTYTFLSFP